MAKELLAVALAALILFSGCAGPAPPAPPQPNWTAGDATPYADASNFFGYSLYGELAKTSGAQNLVFSPYSISSAMTIAYEGAQGKTAEEMAAAMHLPPGKAALRSSFAGLYGKLNSAGSEVELRTANAIWVHKDYQVKQDYLGILRNAYVAQATNLDFSGGTAEKTINNWVETQTNQKIKDLIPAGTLSPSAPVVITNAVYFKGKWQQEFNKKETTQEKFSLVSGEKADVMMMTRIYDENRTNYAEDSDAQVLELPYTGGKLSMVLVLPKEEGAQGIATVERDLESGKLGEWRAALSPEKVTMFVPRFKLEETYHLEGVLPGMGMPTAFSDDADFGAMTAKKNLKIGQVIHKVYIDVNEEGTEAAPATGVVMVLTSMPAGGQEPIKVFRADRPFFFAIVEKDSGTVLFLGKVMDPRG
jgi:serpin B